MCLHRLRRGIGRVVYNDIYEVSCNDANRVAEAVDLEINDHVCGDIDELRAYVKAKSLRVSAMASFDVIEHIYDTEGYLRKLRSLSAGQDFRVVFGSEANAKNPLVKKRLGDFHLRCEYENREEAWGHKKRDTSRSFLDIRREIIKDYRPELGRKEREELASRTRGLAKPDIEKCVDEYCTTGSTRYEPTHPTNTCDPYTGNWQERFMETEWLEAILRDEGFKVEIRCGYWSYSKGFWKRLAKKMLNMAIGNLGKHGLVLSPSYIICADYCEIDRHGACI